MTEIIRVPGPPPSQSPYGRVSQDTRDKLAWLEEHPGEWIVFAQSTRRQPTVSTLVAKSRRFDVKYRKLAADDFKVYVRLRPEWANKVQD